MRNRLLLSVVGVAMLAFSSPMFAQTYGTGGYVPGAWQPSDLPKGLPKAKPFDPHDLSGVWVATETSEPHSLNGEGTKHNSPPPMTAAGKARFDANLPSKGPRAVVAGLGNSPVSTCDPLGYPMSMWAANLRPFEFLEAPASDRVLQHMQYHGEWRQIWTDGRPLPKNPQPAWEGYAVGKWDGDTFVVTSTGYDDRSWLDIFGDPHSSQMRLEERYRRVDKDTLELTMTLTDPMMYTKPWLGDKLTYKNAKVEIYEELCVPSEEDTFNKYMRDVNAGTAPPPAKPPAR